MNGITEAAQELHDYLEQLGASFCIIGGLAVIRWGEYRGTQDVDVSVLVDFGAEREFAEQVLNRFAPRIESAAEFAQTSRVVLATASNGVHLDIALSGYSFETDMIARATIWNPNADIAIRTVSAEDLIVLKAFAGRDHDWVDVRGILRLQKETLDHDATVERLSALCELTESTAPVDRLRQLIDECA